MNGSQSDLKLYIVSCHVDKPLTQTPPESKYDHMIQAGAALTDKRICPTNDMDDCPSNISDRNRRYSEASAMYWIGQHIDSEYVGIVHYRRRLDLTDAQYEAFMNDGVDIITTHPLDIGKTIEQDYREVLYSADWDLFMDILQRNDPDDFEFAKKCYADNLIHACNINVFKADLYRQFSDWAFPIMDEFYRNSPEKTDVYQHRDVGFIAERLSHLFVMKMIRDGKKVVEAPLVDLRSDEWDCKKECDYSDTDAVFDTCDRLYRAGQITKCCNVLGESVRRGGKKDERLNRLSRVLTTGIIERRELPLTMHEYLPEELRKDLSTLLYVWDAFEKALDAYMTLKNDQSEKILEDCLHMTGFSKVAMREAMRALEPNDKAETDSSLKEDIDLILFTGGLITLDTFVRAMVKDVNAVIVDVKKPEETLAPIIDRVNENTTVISFNNIGTGYELWKQRNVSLYNILVDHPANYLESISSDYYPGYHALCIDRGHVEFLKDIFYQVPSAFSFLPHGGIRPDHKEIKKDIDILYAGGFIAEDDINFVPLPFGDSEAFFDHAIAYYDKGSYVEAQDAVNDYCEKDGQEYSREQRAIMTNYIVRSVEHYFIAERRKGLVTYLADNGFNVCVVGNPVWQEVADAHSGIRYEGMKTPEECLRYIARAKVLINDLPYFSDGAHERIFNGMLNGAVVLSNPSRYLEERFTDGENILFWDGRDYEQAARKIREVLENDVLRAKIAQNAAKLADKDTWADRLCTILKQNNNIL